MNTTTIVLVKSFLPNFVGVGAAPIKRAPSVLNEMSTYRSAVAAGCRCTSYKLPLVPRPIIR